MHQTYERVAASRGNVAGSNDASVAAAGEDPAADGLSSLSEYSRRFAAEVGPAPPLT